MARDKQSQNIIGFNEELEILRKESQALIEKWEFILEDLTAVNLFFNGVVNEFSTLIDSIFEMWDEMEGGLDMPEMSNLKNLLKSQIQGFKNSIPDSIDFEQFKKDEEEQRQYFEKREKSFLDNFFAYRDNPDQQLLIHRNYNAEIKNDIDKLKNQGAENRAFLTRISNELMMPINSFMGFSDSLFMMNSPDEVKGLFESINQSARNFSGLLNDYTLFKEIRDKSVYLRKADFNFQDELIEIIEKYSARAQDQGMELFYNIDQAVPNNIISDKKRIVQIISLILENSFLITTLTNKIEEKSGGRINLELKPVDNQSNILRISVIDYSVKFKKSRLNEVHQYYSYYHHLAPYAGLKLKIIAGLAGIIDSKLCLESNNDRNSFYFDLKYDSL